MAETLRDFVARRSRLVVITGAGISTASGIGDYRDANGDWKRVAPMQHDAFVRSPLARQRYWARSFHGWPAIAGARPNAAHLALTAPAFASRLTGVITQNVDGLHQAAGQKDVLDLHGRLDRVICLGCGSRSPRAAFQDALAADNDWLVSLRHEPAPDGDADLALSEGDIARVRVRDCAACGGVLKPDVVFYGDNVPRARVDAAYAWVDQADGVLVVGSSLMVFSSFRFCRRAAERGVPLAAVNLGRTRADALFQVKTAQSCETVLPELAEALA
ncbi:MAG: NAD-dependent protein deacetylase [Pseudomonadales bacterium]|nr:NAD-dependent protein deacetylase [Pseudomonadales bacterium]